MTIKVQKFRIFKSRGFRQGEKTENFGPKPNKTPNCGHFICVHNTNVLNFCFHHFTAWNSRDKRKRFKREKMGGDMCMVGRRVSF